VRFVFFCVPVCVTKNEDDKYMTCKQCRTKLNAKHGSTCARYCSHCSHSVLFHDMCESHCVTQSPGCTPSKRRQQPGSRRGVRFCLASTCSKSGIENGDQAA